MTALLVVAVALAAAAAPAAAGFVYVPPDEAPPSGTAETLVPETLVPETLVPETLAPGRLAPGTEPAARGPEPGTPAAEPAAPAGPAVWRIHAGETLREALARWGARAGVDVTFLTDRRYRLDAAAAFEGPFADAAQALLRGLAHLPHPPAGALTADGRSLAVTHRSRRAAEREVGQ